MAFEVGDEVQFEQDRGVFVTLKVTSGHLDFNVRSTLSRTCMSAVPSHEPAAPLVDPHHNGRGCLAMHVDRIPSWSADV